MATIVNLDIGGSGSESPPVYTVNLVLANNYTEPSPRLLVLRSRPDIDSISGAMAVVEATDISVFDVFVSLPTDVVTGTLAATDQADIASFAGTTSAYDVSGTWASVASDDVVQFTGDGFSSIPLRTVTLNALEQQDTASVTAEYTAKWIALIGATEPGDTVSFSGNYLAYVGPGFLNTTDQGDTASFIGTIIYNVAGDMLAVEAADVAEISARSQEVVEAETTDFVVFSDVITSESFIASLVDQVYATDLISDSQDLVFADTLWVGDSLVSTLNVSLLRSDTAYVTDELGGQAWGVSFDTAQASDGLNGEISLIHEDQVLLSDGLTSQLAITDALADIVGVTDTLFAVVGGTIADTITASEVLDGPLDQQETVVDVVLAGDALVSGLSISESLTDSVVSSDIVDAIELVATTDTVQFTDLIEGTVNASDSFSDTLLNSDILAGGLTVYAPLLTDTGIVSEVLTSAAQLQLVGILADTALAGDSLHEAAQTVYVVNAETGAVSTYVFTPVITSMTEYRGVLYLSGPEGLYALDATEDDTGSVVWTLRTGFSNLGTDKLKRVHDCNMQLRTEGDTTFQVVTDRYGTKEEWNYRITPALSRESYRDGVVKIGRGIQSVYWQLAAQGVGPAEIDQLRVVVEPLSRRR